MRRTSKPSKRTSTPKTPARAGSTTRVTQLLKNGRNRDRHAAAHKAAAENRLRAWIDATVGAIDNEPIDKALRTIRKRLPKGNASERAGNKVTDAMLRTNPNRLRGGKAAAWAFLARASLNGDYDEGRAAASRAPHASLTADNGSNIDLADTRPASPDISPARRELIAQVEAALETLTPLQQAAIELTHKYGLPRAAVAYRMGVPKTTVGSHLSRGLAALREKLRPDALSFAS